LRACRYELHREGWTHLAREELTRFVAELTATMQRLIAEPATYLQLGIVRHRSFWRFSSSGSFDACFPHSPLRRPSEEPHRRRHPAVAGRPPARAAIRRLLGRLVAILEAVALTVGSIHVSLYGLVPIEERPDCEIDSFGDSASTCSSSSGWTASTTAGTESAATSGS
jgi:hypothetical protein